MDVIFACLETELVQPGRMVAPRESGSATVVGNN